MKKINYTLSFKGIVKWFHSIAFSCIIALIISGCSIDSILIQDCTLNLYNNGSVTSSIRGDCSINNPHIISLAKSSGDNYTINATNGSYTSVEGSRITKISGGSVVRSETKWTFTRINETNKYAEFVLDTSSIYGNCEIGFYNNGKEDNVKRGFCNTLGNEITLTTIDENRYTLNNFSDTYTAKKGDTETIDKGNVEVLGRSWMYWEITSGLARNNKIVEIRLN